MNPERKEYGVYVNSMLSKRVTLGITEIGKNVKQNLEKKIKHSIEGRCISEGFIRPKTVEILTYSSGLIKDDYVEFQVIYRCLICNPIKDMEMDCIVNNVTKAGVHAFVKDDDDNTPVTVFVARDHNISNSMFESVQEKDHIRVRIIGTRYELNDPTITAIASLIPSRVERREPRREVGEFNYQQEPQEELLRVQEPQEELLRVQEPQEELLRVQEPQYKYEYKEPEPEPKPFAVVYDEEAIKNAKKRKIVIKK